MHLERKTAWGRRSLRLGSRRPAFLRPRGGGALILVALALSACSGPALTIDLMPSPDLYSQAGYDPFGEEAPLTSLPDFEVVYATLRDPATEDDDERFYANRRGNLLRVGMARVQAGDEDFTWEQARRVSLLKDRPDSYPLKVTSVDELGVVASSIFAPAEVRATEPDARAAFARRVDERLDHSRTKDVYVYVHGYKVVFENPVLVASELWHFLGYEGVMVAFSWPATPSKLAYFSDLETAAMSARGLRRLLSVLAQDTQVERIHVLGYSAGTRVVAEALNQLALLHRGEEPEQVFARRKLGQVVLVGSDIDRQTMGAYLEEGLLGVLEHLSVYVSRSDEALGLSRWVMGGRERLGQSFGEGAMSAEAEAFLRSTPEMTVVDVTDAEDFDAGNGHSYFRRSPWVASDVLLTLGHGLGPAERGLVREAGSPIWSFPRDYVERLQELLPRLPYGAAHPSFDREAKSTGAIRASSRARPAVRGHPSPLAPERTPARGARPNCSGTPHRAVEREECATERSFGARGTPCVPVGSRAG